MQSSTSALVGAIVFCWYPEDETSCQPGPKFRPAMILEVDEAHRRILVAYGTSQRTEQNGLGELTIRQDQMPKLPKSTRFCFRKRLWLPITADYFHGPNNRGLSVIGFPPASMRTQLLNRLEEAML